MWTLTPERAKDGSWWVMVDGQWSCVYNPLDYDFVHSTLLDNPHLMARDPDLMRKLSAMPKDKRDKFLYGELDAISGQFFDCWEPGVHVMKLEEVPDRIIWQPWQPRWIGWDWGRVHHSCASWQTLALVKGVNGEFKLKVVVYREYVDKRRQDYRSPEQNNVSAMTRMGLPGCDDKLRAKSNTLDAIYFSHEKFAKQMELQSPAMIMSAYLTELGLPAARQATRDRVGRANLLYDTLKTLGIVVLDSCPETIDAIPQLIRDEKNIEDVKKLETKADDVYDGVSLGLFGQLGRSETPDEVKLAERLAGIEDPLWRTVQQVKATWERNAVGKEDNRPDWMRR